MKREDLAWLAGLFDGEGHVGRNPKTNAIYAEISQSSSAGLPFVLVKAQETLGFGKVNGPYYSETRVSMYRFRVSGFEKVQALFAMIWPWLGPVKREQFKAALKGFLETKRSTGAYSFIRTLWPHEAELFLVENYKTMTVDEIGAVLGRRPSTVKSKVLSLGLKKRFVK